MLIPNSDFIQIDNLFIWEDIPPRISFGQTEIIFWQRF